MACLVASGAFAQATIATGPHDFSAGSALRNTGTPIDGQTCVFCHTPHGGSTSIPLWNRIAPTTGYTVYTSSTSTATTTADGIRSSVSGACLSCHDGSIGVDVLVNLGGSTVSTNTPRGVSFTAQGSKTFGTAVPGTNNLLNSGAAYLSSDLRNDHPVNIIYETARALKSSEFVLQTGTTKITVGATNPLPLYGTTTASATVECASCHNPHNNSNDSFLRKSNSGSAICLSCHIK
jgi:predicted CXXCH cytochrome family protein